MKYNKIKLFRRLIIITFIFWLSIMVCVNNSRINHLEKQIELNQITQVQEEPAGFTLGDFIHTPVPKITDIKNLEDM